MTFNQIRKYELSFIVRHIHPGQRILDFGAGTGVQAKYLSDLGFDVVAVDLATSSYHQNTVYDVSLYDGNSLPFDDNAFDVVISSNVLEHIDEKHSVFNEITRVLSPGGFCIHLMPSTTWRLSTTIIGPFVLIKNLLQAVFSLFIPCKHNISRDTLLSAVLKSVITPILPLPHGCSPTAFHELISFKTSSWISLFYQYNYLTIGIYPVEIFYSGHFLLGNLLPLSFRITLSRILGPASFMYIIKPKPSIHL